MINNERPFTVIDMAYEIIDVYETNQRLRSDVKHLETINAILQDGVNASSKHTEQMAGALLLHAIGANDAARELLERD